MTSTARDSILLLDGGTGQELLRRAVADPSPLWSTQVMLDEPDLVRRVHADYLDAGADAITVNAYCATRCRLGPAGRDDDYERLQRLACELANEARADHPDAMILGCLSPYGWTYRPELAPPYDELWPQYAESAALQAPYVDAMLCETMGSVEEARAAVRGASVADRPIWVSWTLRDDGTNRLRSGEPLDAAIDAIDALGIEVAATLVNCSEPDTIAVAMAVLADGGHRFGGYANGFEHIAAEFQPGSTTGILGHRHDLGPDSYADDVERWIDSGATIVGGCCEIGPAHIAALAERLGRTGADRTVS